MLSLDQLKNLDLNRPSMEELVFLLAVATMMKAEFEKFPTLEMPEWLDSRSRELKREINSRTEDARAKRISEIKSRMDSLKTPAEKRADLERELERLTATAV